MFYIAKERWMPEKLQIVLFYIIINLLHCFLVPINGDVAMVMWTCAMAQY